MTAHDIHGPRARVMRRALTVLLVLVASAALAAPAALATEEAVPAEGAEQRLTFEELQRNTSPRAQEFFPDPYQEPSFFQWISIPVLLGGLVITAGLLGAYLWWQPKFAAERRQKQRR